jgi:hypothetical protein
MDTLRSCKLGSVPAKLSPRLSRVECECAFVNKFFHRATEFPVSGENPRELFPTTITAGFDR